MFSNFLNRYNKISKKYDKEFDISKNFLFDLICRKNLFYRSYFSGFLTNLILFCLSEISIILCKFKGIKVANYFIIFKDSNGEIDFRSKYILDYINLKKTINIVRCASFKDSIKAYIKYPNVIFYLSISYFKKPFFDLNNKNYLEQYQIIHESELKIYQKFKNIFSFLRIKKFITIDDQRIMQSFLKICKELNIQSTGYMHYKFTKYVIGIKLECFDNFFVWTDYFKKKLINVNKKYKDKKIVITGFLKKDINKKISRKINVLYLIDLNISFKEISKKILLISEIKNINLMIKLKPQKGGDIEWENFAKKKQIKIFYKEHLDEINMKYNIDYFICTISTALLEAPSYSAMPIKIKTNNDFADDLVKEKLVLLVKNNKDLLKELKKKPNKSKIDKLFKKVWGEKKYNGNFVKREIQKILEI